jgi:hypothetical protein
MLVFRELRRLLLGNHRRLEAVAGGKEARRWPGKENIMLWLAPAPRKEMRRARIDRWCRLRCALAINSSRRAIPALFPFMLIAISR